MFSESLLIADRNTVKLMIDELREGLAAKDSVIAEKDNALAEKDNALAEKDAEIQRLRKQLAEAVK